MIYIMNFTWKHSSGCIWHPLAKLEINISGFNDSYEEGNQACRCPSYNETRFYFSVKIWKVFASLEGSGFWVFFISSSKVLFSCEKNVVFFFLWIFSGGGMGEVGNHAYCELSSFSIIFFNVYLYYMFLATWNSISLCLNSWKLVGELLARRVQCWNTYMV